MESGMVNDGWYDDSQWLVTHMHVIIAQLGDATMLHILVNIGR